MTVALVTGGAGFIGSHVVRTLHGQGVTVRVLDNLSGGSRRNLEGLPVELIVGDVRDRRHVHEAMTGVDQVFHLAAMVSVPESVTDPLTCFEVNLMGSLNVLWQAHEQVVKSVVLSSSCAVYGDTDEPAGEGDAPRPLSPYAASKLAMEDAARLFHDLYKVPIVILRYFNVYGPRQAPDSAYAAVIPVFIRCLLGGKAPMIDGDGRQTRDFIYVEDVAQANLLAAQADHAAGRVYNIASGKNVSILDLASDLADLTGTKDAPGYGPARPGDIRHSLADTERANKELGFRAMTSLREGLGKTLDWFRQEKKTIWP